MGPKITVITPTFNRAKLLPMTIESVLRQTLADFEYIILDDGSTDNTQEVVAPYLKDQRVIYLYHDNLGEAETANKGWSLAKGEYFTQINSDDPVYPNFLEVMVRELDNQPEMILAYPDFDFIDEDGNVTYTTKGRPWNFLRNLSEFSCEAACPGTMFRRSAFADLPKIKHHGFLHINDVEMYWNLALRGEFLYVPHILATWRRHEGQISNERYKAIPECEAWFESYFSRGDLPMAVRQIQPQTRASLCRYFIKLLENSSLPLSEKRRLSSPYKKELRIDDDGLRCAQIGDNDLHGSKFNGHDLHLYLREKKIEAVHFVCWKRSNDQYTWLINNHTAQAFMRGLISNENFVNADVVHLHLIHNTNFDILHLPFLSSLKPIVWTLHDPWAFGGHCTYHGDCEKWKTHCQDCQFVNIPIKQERDLAAFEFSKKFQAIHNSQITAIVASAWMRDKAAASPIWQGKKIHLVPFGINQRIFAPGDMRQARNEHNIDPEALVFFARTENHFKGLSIINETMRILKAKRPIVLLTVGQNGLLKDLAGSVRHMEFGWVYDDNKLAQLYRACDLFLMPSEQEAFGMMAIEAMSCGKMVLAIKGTSLPEVVNAPECGLAVEKREYASELQRLCDNGEEIARRGELSLEFAKIHYNHDIYVDGIVSVYRSAIEDFAPNPKAVLVLEQLLRYAREATNSTNAAPTSSIPSSSIKKALEFYKMYGAIKTVAKITEKFAQKILNA